MRPSKRGAGETRQVAAAELILPDGSAVTKDKAVTEKLTEIIGVDRSQFTQIAMIAQGDFLKLLLADTRDRQKIFRDIFNTAFYQRLQDRLKADSNALYRDFEKLRNSTEQYVEGIVYDEEGELAEEAEELKRGGRPYPEITAFIERLIESDRSILHENADRIAKLDKSLSALNIRKQSLEEYKALAESYSQNLEKLSSCEAEELVRSEHFQREEEKLPEHEQMARRIAGIQLQYEEYDRLDKIKKDIENALHNHSTAVDEGKRKAAETRRLTVKLEELKQELAQKQNAGEIRQKLLSEQSRITEEKNKINEISSAVELVKSSYKKLRQAQEAYVAAQTESQQRQQRHDAAYRAFLDNQAGILAASLVEGSPCPVCGSTSHPSRAVMSDHAPSEKEVNALRAEADKALKQAADRSSEASRIKGGYDAAVEALKLSVKGKYDGFNNQELQEALKSDTLKSENALSLLADELKKAEQDVRRKQELDGLIPQNEKALEAARNGAQEAERRAAAGAAGLEQLRKQQTEISERLSYSSRAEAVKAVEQLEKELAAAKGRLETARKELEETKNEIIRLKGVLSEQKQSVDKKPEYGQEETEAKLDECQKQRNALEEKDRSLHTRITQNSTALDSILKRMEEISGIEERMKVIKSLADTANGGLGGKERIMLETYIQMTYFDRIINRANSRLMIMTNGKYDLKRRETASNLRSQSGLELDVIDHYNGTVRSVRTLSGGESFMASLSLALGLSDEIMSAAGGIRLDTMFVDEGFGSLDGESLQQAMKALSSLADGNRLVGIISHVSELKERIDNQIIVSRERSGGSSVRIVSAL